MSTDRCYCPDGAECMNWQCDYPWCRSCGEHHRLPECAVDQEGYALNSDGERWVDVDNRLGIHMPPGMELVHVGIGFPP